MNDELVCDTGQAAATIMIDNQAIPIPPFEPDDICGSVFDNALRRLHSESRTPAASPHVESGPTARWSSYLL